MDQNDHELETFLREFTPRQPRALPTVPAEIPAHVRDHHRGQRIAAAVLLTIAGSASVWLASRQNASNSFSTVLPTATPSKAGAPEKSFPSLVLLERLALEDPAQFDATMSEASRRILQHVNDSEPVLRTFAKD
jgi:hypothetical protein